MKLENFKAFLRRRPFRPFLIYTASGENYSVASPESILVSPDGDVVLAYPPTGGLVMLGVEHITEAMYPARKRSKGKSRDTE